MAEAPWESRWRELFAPWRDPDEYDALGRLHHAVMDEGDSCVDTRNVLWFRWMPAREEIAAQLELLSLMAALCAYDVATFESLLANIDDDYTRYFVESRAQYEREYTMGVYVKIDDDEMLTIVRDALLENASVTQQYVTVRQELLEARDPVRCVPLLIEFESRAVAPKEAIVSAVTLVERLNSQDGNETIGSAFRVEAVQFDVYEGGQLDVDGMAQLAKLMELGVRLPFFQFGTPFSMARTADVLTQTVETVHALLAPRCIEDIGDLSQPRLEHLEITTPMPTSLAVSACTAIAQSDTLKFLEIDHNMARRFGREQFPMDRFWRWLAYALFSRNATHNIQKLEVTAEILGDFDADIIREVIAWDDPLFTLIDPRSQIDAPLANTFVYIPSGTEISLVYDYTRLRKEIATFTTTSALTALRVLQDREVEGWISFVLPGWGECRVCRDVVTVQPGTECPAVSSTVAMRGIPHLRLDYISTEDVDAVCAFLDVVGHHVRRLDIHEFDEDEEHVAPHIVSFIRRCPSLEVLDLFSTKMGSIDPLVQAFVRGDCSIKRLKLRQVHVNPMSSMHAFFDTLADPSHRMTACLRELSFHIFEQTIEDPARGSILASCAKMLGENHQLQVCRAITMSRRRCAQFAAVFQEFDSQPLPTRKGPLALRSKIAFLSVVLSRGRDEVSPALDRIDTNVLQAIFQFAAEHEVRQSSIEVPVRKW